MEKYNIPAYNKKTDTGDTRHIMIGDYADVAIADPPRKGCGQELLNSMGMMKPEKVVYVSCDPGTLARDIGILTEKGYKVEEIQPVDMLPGTGHVEV